MKKLSEIYDLVRKGELKNGDSITFMAEVLTKKETDRFYLAKLSNGKNFFVNYFGRKSKKEISPLFSKLKIDKTFIIKGTLWCSKDCSEFSLDNLIFVSDNKALSYRLEYLDTGNILYKLYSYMENNSEGAANEFFFSNKEAIMDLLHNPDNYDKITAFLCDYQKHKNHIAFRNILTTLIKTNYKDNFGENLLMSFISGIFNNVFVNKNPYCKELKINAAKYLNEVIDEIPDEIINDTDDVGDNVVNDLCHCDILSPIIEKLLKRNVSFNTINDIYRDSLGEAITCGSKTIVSLIVNSGKVKITDKHKELAEAYFVKL
jgi:hypothetical protein